MNDTIEDNQEQEKPPTMELQDQGEDLNIIFRKNRGKYLAAFLGFAAAIGSCAIANFTIKQVGNFIVKKSYESTKTEEYLDQILFEPGFTPSFDWSGGRDFEIEAYDPIWFRYDRGEYTCELDALGYEFLDEKCDGVVDEIWDPTFDFESNLLYKYGAGKTQELRETYSSVIKRLYEYFSELENSKDYAEHQIQEIFRNNAKRNNLGELNDDNLQWRFRETYDAQIDGINYRLVHFFGENVNYTGNRSHRDRCELTGGSVFFIDSYCDGVPEEVYVNGKHIVIFGHNSEQDITFKHLYSEELGKMNSALQEE